MSDGPLTGITVLDLSRVLAGPYCTMVLADLGARVIKIEKPRTGDDARHVGPFIDRDGEEISAYFASLNRGKESIALDLKVGRDVEIFDALLERSDVLVENFRPGVMARLGYDWPAVHRRFPHLIYAAVSGFGQTGPYAHRAAYDMVVQAMGGIMSITGHPGGAPTRVGTSIGDITAGLFTAIGINGALYERARTGLGRLIDVGMLDCQIAILENAIARFQASGISPGPLGARHPSITPFAAFRTADGHMVIAAGNDGLFRRLAKALGIAEIGEDPRFASNELRTRNADTLAREIEAATSRQPTSHWLDVLGDAGIPCGPINDVAAALSDPQVLARNMVVEDGFLKMAGNPVKFSDVDDPAERQPAPALDADRSRILKEIG